MLLVTGPTTPAWGCCAAAMQPLEPARGHHDVAVEQHQVVAAGVGQAQVVAGGVAQVLLAVDGVAALLVRGQLAQPVGGAVGAAVVDEDDLVPRVGVGQQRGGALARVLQRVVAEHDHRGGLRVPRARRSSRSKRRRGGAYWRNRKSGAGHGLPVEVAVVVGRDPLPPALVQQRDVLVQLREALGARSATRDARPRSPAGRPAASRLPPASGRGRRPRCRSSRLRRSRRRPRRPRGAPAGRPRSGSARSWPCRRLGESAGLP